MKNIVNDAFLAVALAPKRLYAGWGINLPQLRSILRFKLMMDDRYPTALQISRTYDSSKDRRRLATLFSMLSSLLLGLIMLFSFAVGSDPAMEIGFYFTFFISALSLMLISDFASILLDVRDNLIILPKPVNDRTVFAARLLHILIHVCKILFPMILPGLIFILIRRGLPHGALFFGLIFPATLFSVFLVNALYLFLLKVTTPERFRGIISYVQIIFTIAVYAGSQVLPRFMLGNLGEPGLRPDAWWQFLPPFWFGFAYKGILTGQLTGAQWVAASMAVAVPLLSIWVVVKYLAPGFNRKMAMAAGSEGPARSRRRAENGARRGAWLDQLAAAVCIGREERAGFRFAWKMMTRSREFRLKVYPMIGYLVVMIAYPFIQATISGAGRGIAADSFAPAASVYILSLPLISAIWHLIFSEKYRASWMFYVSPLAQPGLIMSGAVKAVIVQFTGPFLPVVLAYGIWMGGPAQIPSLLLGVSNLLVIAFFIATISFKQLPFSQPPVQSQKGENYIMSFVIMLFAGFVAMVHYFLFHRLLLVVAGLAVSVAVLIRMMWQIRSQEWGKIRPAEEI